MRKVHSPFEILHSGKQSGKKSHRLTVPLTTVFKKPQFSIPLLLYDLHFAVGLNGSNGCNHCIHAIFDWGHTHSCLELSTLRVKTFRMENGACKSGLAADGTENKLAVMVKWAYFYSISTPTLSSHHILSMSLPFSIRRTVFISLAKTASPFTFVASSALHILLSDVPLFKLGNFILITMIPGDMKHTRQLLPFRPKDGSHKSLLAWKPSHCAQNSELSSTNIQQA